MEKTEGFKTKEVEIQELSEQELKFGYWFVTHKAQLKKAGIISLIVFSAITLGYAIFMTTWFYAVQYQEYQQTLSVDPGTYIDYETLRQISAIQPLQVLSRDVLSAGDGKVDIAVLVLNPNTKWSLDKVTYQISHAGKFYKNQESFVLPGEQKYLLLLNVDGAPSGTPQVLFEDQDWKRVILYEEWGPGYTNFLITNKKFLSARQAELAEKLPISEAQADITNATAYNYNEVEIQIALYAGSKLAGITKIALQDFESGDQRRVVGRWTERLSSISTVEIIPTVNILDESSFSEYEGEFAPGILEENNRRY